MGITATTTPQSVVVTDADLSAMLTAATAATANLERLYLEIRAAESVRHSTFHAAVDAEATLRGDMERGYDTDLAARFALVEDAATGLVEAGNIVTAVRPASCPDCRAIHL